MNPRIDEQMWRSTLATIRREEEEAYKRGFDAGVAYQKRADPPPEARDLAKQLDAVERSNAALRVPLLALTQWFSRCRPHMRLTVDRSINVLTEWDAIEAAHNRGCAALAADAGKDFVPRAELERVTKQLDEGRAVCRALLDSLSDAEGVSFSVLTRAEAFARGES